MMEHQLKLIERQIDAAKADQEKVKERLAELSVTVSKSAGENEKLFGSVTTRDIQAALEEEGVTIDRRRVIIKEPIKALGVYTVQIKLYGGEFVEIKVWVVAQ
jgi:large subunit ribosomal protein L9